MQGYLWGSYANSNMSTLLYPRCLHGLIRLTLAYEHKVEYVHTFLVARLLNEHPWFERLPGLPLSEEPYEATLSSLVAELPRFPHMDCLQQVQHFFVPVTPVVLRKRT